MKSTDIVSTTRDQSPPALRQLAAWMGEPMGRLRSEIDKLFDDFPTSANALSRFAGSGSLLAPPLDMIEGEKEYKLSVELPGLDDEDIEITVAEGMLRIAGEKKEESERKEKGFILSERRFGSFERRIALPTDVDAAAIKAKFKDGILTITLAKDEKAIERTRKIAVEIED